MTQVAQPTMDKSAARRSRLDTLARQAGFDTWRLLETAVLHGEAVIARARAVPVLTTDQGRRGASPKASQTE